MPNFVFTRNLSAAVATLALAAAPAFAQSSAIERVEVRSRVVEATPRHDVHAACTSMDEQLLRALARTWVQEGRYGEVKVQLVLENGRVGSVKTQGVSNTVARKVRAAVHQLACAPQTTAGAEVYRFSVDFIDPDAPVSGETRSAARSLRING